MQYFVTGATGFIGKRLVRKLLERKGSVVHFLIRPESEGKVAGLREYWGLKGSAANRAVPVFGDLTAKRLGVTAEVQRVLDFVAQILGQVLGHPLPDFGAERQFFRGVVQVHGNVSVGRGLAQTPGF